LFGGGVLYVLLMDTVREEIDEKLAVNKDRIVAHIHTSNQVTSIPPIIEVKQVDKKTILTGTAKDTFLFDPIEKDTELFRELTSNETVNGKVYQVTIRQAILEPHDYFNKIGAALLLVWILLLLSFFLINWRVSKSIWKSFHNNLLNLKRFKIGDSQPLRLENSNIKEFKELNETIKELADRVVKDYHVLKEFSENAAHEMQTPLSIIQTKLESTLQSSHITENMAKEIQSSLSAVHRLSKLNQTLLLLTKIENRQFSRVEPLNISKRVESILEEFAELIEAKNICLEKSLEPAKVSSDPHLLDILITNLISNAIKHNTINGTIRVNIKPGSFTVSNTSEETITIPENMFNRFTKANQASSSLGLGLSIVKGICEIQEWDITYTVQGNWHIFVINF